MHETPSFRGFCDNECHELLHFSWHFPVWETTWHLRQDVRQWFGLGLGVTSSVKRWAEIYRFPLFNIDFVQWQDGRLWISSREFDSLSRYQYMITKEHMAVSLAIFGIAAVALVTALMEVIKRRSGWDGWNQQTVNLPPQKATEVRILPPAPSAVSSVG